MEMRFEISERQQDQMNAGCSEPNAEPRYSDPHTQIQSSINFDQCRNFSDSEVGGAEQGRGSNLQYVKELGEIDGRKSAPINCAGHEPIAINDNQDCFVDDKNTHNHV